MRRTHAIFLAAALAACGGAQTKPAAKATGATKAVPEGFHSVTPHLIVSDVDAAVAYYEKAFGARHRYSMKGPDGKTTMHAEIQLGDSVVMLSPEMPEEGSKAPATVGGTCGGLLVYVENVDAVQAAAVAAGGKERTPVADQFWGDRFGRVQDPSGHIWSLATHTEEVPDAEMEKRGAAWAQALAEGKTPPVFARGTPARSWKPDGYFTVTPALLIAGGEAELVFYEKALGAAVVAKMAGPGGSLGHAELKIGDSIVIMSSEEPTLEPDMKAPRNLGATPLTLMLYVEDADAAYARARAGGAAERTPPADVFWGDRFAEITDPSGHSWGIATHVKDLTPEQIHENMRKAFGGAAGD